MNWPPQDTDLIGDPAMPDDTPRTFEPLASPSEVDVGQSLRVHLSPEDKAKLQQALIGPHMMKTSEALKSSSSSQALDATHSTFSSSTSTRVSNQQHQERTARTEAADVSTTATAPHTTAPAATTTPETTAPTVVDKNTDRIKALVQRFLRAPATGSYDKVGISLNTGSATTSVTTSSRSTSRLKAGDGKAAAAAAAANRSLVSSKEEAAPPSRIRSALQKVTARKGSSTAASSTPIARTASMGSSLSLPIFQSVDKLQGNALDVGVSASAIHCATLDPSSSSSSSSSEVVSDLDIVLKKYVLPADVTGAVIAAVAAKQLPSKPASLDALLARLLMPSSGLKPELVHTGMS
jgi:hypothetical protein